MPRDDSKSEVKQALREVLDEMGATYATGAGAFVDTIIVNLSAMGDAFDNYYLRNLMRDRPAAAVTFVDLRIRSIKKASILLDATLKKMTRMGIKARQAASRRRGRGGRVLPSRRRRA